MGTPGIGVPGTYPGTADAIMSVFRAFIAIDLPPHIQDKLDRVTEHFKQRLPDAPVRWVPASNVHLTLKFLGEVSEANYSMLTEILEVQAAEYGPIEISIGGLGAFPNKRRPRVIWIGVAAPSELEMLQRAIEAETTRLGYASEKRPFAPHLTVGRVMRNAGPGEIRKISQVLSSEEVGYLGVARITSVDLFRSDLKPGGAVYTRMYAAALDSAAPFL